MKKLIIVFVAISQYAFAQTIDYNQVIPSSKTPNLETAEKLVLIAWNNHPENKAAQNQINIAEEELIQAKWSWLDIFSINGNLNEYTINPEEESPGEFGRFNQYPRYNVGASINLSIFGQKPAEIRKSRELIEIAEANLNSRKLELRAAVLTAYQNYLMHEQLFQLQTQSTEDAYASYSLAEQQFQNGSLTLEEYTISLNNYNTAQKDKIIAQNEFLNSKIALESLIGVPVETVIK